MTVILAKPFTLNKFVDVVPRSAERLIELGLDPYVKPYAQIQAIAESFRGLQAGVIDRENRDSTQFATVWKHWKVGGQRLFMYLNKPLIFKEIDHQLR